MLFTSSTFAIFLVVVFCLYWLVWGGRRRAQNALLLCASYVFYGWWDWRFLSLIVLSSLVDFVVSRRMSSSRGATRRALLMASIATNLGLLGVFKYYDFFVQSLAEAAHSLGVSFDLSTLGLILPVGISFYTFQTLSYSIDVYRRRLEPTDDALAFFAYVSFFPQLVAGPIERAKNLLPQFLADRKLDEGAARDGLRQMLWGLFKKVVVADSCAPLVDEAFSHPEGSPSIFLAAAVVLFAFQIYCDFSGYSDIARGCARLFGIELSQNFSYPYFSRDVGEFWRRWHISLSTWFRDYVYIPLGGSRMGRVRAIRNVSIVFVVSGAWHGANWTFLTWGALHALFFLPLLLTQRNRQHVGTVAEDRSLPTAGEVLRMTATFALVCLGWVFFRADSVGAGVHYLLTLFSAQNLSVPLRIDLLNAFALIALMLAIEWRGRRDPFPLHRLRGGTGRRWTVYLALSVLVLLHGKNQDAFIYFQF